MLLLLWILLRTGYVVLGATIRGAEGQSVTLPCMYAATKEGVTSMCWGMGECSTFGCSSKFIVTDGQKVTWSNDSRYQLKGDIPRGDVSLTIQGARPSDNGMYCCRVELLAWGNDQKDTLTLVVDSGLDHLTPILISPATSSLTSVQSPEGAHPTQVTVSLTVSVLSVSVLPAGKSSDSRQRPQNQSTQNSALMHPGGGVQGSQKATSFFVYGFAPVMLLALTVAAAGFYIRRPKAKKSLEQASPLPMGTLEPGGVVSALEGPNHAEDNVYIME